MICSVEGCDKKVKAKGYCNNHYARFKRNGDPVKEMRPKIDQSKPCSWCGEEKKIVANGMCNNCYHRKWKKGTAEYEVHEPTECTVEGCSNTSKTKGLCQKHYMRNQRHGHTDQTRQKGWGVKEGHQCYNSWGHLKKKRGIEDVDPRWLDDFWIFVEEVGEKPAPRYTLKLVDTNKGYYKGNYVWTAPVLSKIEAKTKREYMRKYAQANRDNNPDQFASYDLKRKTGIDLDAYNEMFKKQNGVCDICGGKEQAVNLKTGKKRRFAVDHDHKTGKVRALLCTNCNNGLGRFNDDISLMKQAIKYLEKHSK